MDQNYINVSFTRNSPEHFNAFVENLKQVCHPLRLDGAKDIANPGDHVLSVDPFTSHNSIPFERIEEIHDAFAAYDKMKNVEHPEMHMAAHIHVLLTKLEYVAKKIDIKALKNAEDSKIVLKPASAMSIKFDSNELHHREMSAKDFKALHNAITDGYIMVGRQPLTQHFQQAISDDLKEELIPGTKKSIRRAINVIDYIDVSQEILLEQKREEQQLNAPLEMTIAEYSGEESVAQKPIATDKEELTKTFHLEAVEEAPETTIVAFVPDEKSNKNPQKFNSNAGKVKNLNDQIEEVAPPKKELSKKETKRINFLKAASYKFPDWVYEKKKTTVQELPSSKENNEQERINSGNDELNIA